MTSAPVAVHSDAEWAFLRQLGKRIRLERVDHELSQEQLAARAGVSRNFVSSIERGAHSLDVLRLRAVAAALERAPADLLPDAAVPGESVGTCRCGAVPDRPRGSVLTIVEG